MARVMKSFDTEEEYQAWVDGPYMRTPYTCFVRNTGAVHYEDGKDDDYSITLVARKTEWVRLFLPIWGFEYTDVQVFLNGEKLEMDDERMTRAEHRYSKITLEEKFDEGVILNDIEEVNNKFNKSTIISRGVHTPDEFDGYKYHWFGYHVDSDSDAESIEYTYGPERHHLGTYGSKRYYKRFIFVHKDDVVKLVWSNDIQGYFNINQYSTEPVRVLSTVNNCKTGGGTMGWSWAKEIVIGDGIKKLQGFYPRHVRKLYFGKNSELYTMGGLLIHDNRNNKKKTKSRVFCRKETYFGEFDEYEGVDTFLVKI